MREIKFRAWDKNNKRMWWNVQNAYDGQRNHHNPDQTVKQESAEDHLLPSSFGEILMDDGWDVMQYTGLKDKNGKEIYEGDVVRKWWGAHSRRGEIQHIFENHAIEFSQGRVGPCEGENVMEWRLSGCENLWDGNHVEIVGNIYENPELLE